MQVPSLRSQLHATCFLAPLPSPTTPSSKSLSPTGSITLVEYSREDLPLHASYSTLGVPNAVLFEAHQGCFLAPLPGRKISLQGESLTHNLFTLFLFACFFKKPKKISLLFSCLFSLFYQKHKKIRELYSIYLELGHEVFEEKIKKPLELYLHASSDVISMDSLNTIVANALEKSKLGEASFYENDLFSPPSTKEEIYFDDNMPPIFDDYGDENSNDYFMHMAHDKNVSM